MPQPVIDTLDLDYENSIDGVADLEAALGITLADEELAAIETMGQLHALLVGKLVDPAIAGRCASQMAFYRIRAVLADRWPRAMLRPDTALAPLAGKQVPRFRHDLGRRTGLRLPTAKAGWRGSIGRVCALMSGLLLLVLTLTHGFNIYVAAAMAGFILLARSDRPTMPRRLVTLGDLARAAAGLSFGPLAVAGARRDADMIWELLLETFTIDPAKGAVTPQTLFFRPPKSARR